MTKTPATTPSQPLPAGPRLVLASQWRGLGGADFGAALAEARPLARLPQATGWAAGGRRLSAGRPRALAQTYAELLPPLSDLSGRRFAHPEAVETFKRLSIKACHKQSLPSLAYEFRHFTELEPASGQSGA